MSQARSIIIGGGLAGLSTAYHLLKKDPSRRVTILEENTLASGATSKAAGMITPASEVMLGEDRFKGLLGSASLYYDVFVSELTQGNPDLVDFHRSGSLLCALDQDGRRELVRLIDFKHTMGFKVTQLSPAELRQKEPLLSQKIVAAFDVPKEAFIDPIKLCNLLKDRILAMGADIRENTRVTAFEWRGETISGAILADGTSIIGDDFVLASGLGTRIAGLDDFTELSLRPVKGQALAIKAEPGVLHHAVRVFQRYPIYLVPRLDGTIVVGATSEERGDEDLTAGNVLDLLYGAWRALPLISEKPITQIWTGLRPAAPDNRPILGVGPARNLFLLQGLYRHGILAGPYLGLELAALITGQGTDLDWRLYSYRRFSA